MEWRTRTVLSCNGQDYDERDVAALAAWLGVLPRVRRRLQNGLVRIANAEAQGASLPEDALQREVDRWRKAHGLLDAAATQTWLQRRDLTFADLCDYVERSLWQNHRAVRDMELVQEESAVHSQALWAELVLGGSWQRVAENLAVWLAVKQRPLPDNAPPVPGDVLLDRCDTIGVPPDQLDEWLTQHAGATRPHAEWLALEAHAARLRQIVVHEEACRETLAAIEKRLTQVSGLGAGFQRSGEARETYFCVVEDGLDLSQVAEQAGVLCTQFEGFLDEIAGEMRSAMFSARPGETLTPMESDGRWWVLQVTDKRAPSLDDPKVRQRVERETWENVGHGLVRRHVTWADWEGERDNP
jgi:hypothetical protein